MIVIRAKYLVYGAGLRSNDIPPDRLGHRLALGMDMQLIVDTPNMTSHGIDTDETGLGNPLVTHPIDKTRQDFSLPACKVETSVLGIRLTITQHPQDFRCDGWTHWRTTFMDLPDRIEQPSWY